MDIAVDIICQCGCGGVNRYVGRPQRVPRYLRGHNIRGKRFGQNNPFFGHKWTSKMLEKISGSNRYNWSGDRPKYFAVHAWVRRHWPGDKPERCEKCNDVKKLDLANIRNDINGDTYNRNFHNWIWICRRCHLLSDGRAFKNLTRPWEK